jgi:hypothetical protein
MRGTEAAAAAATQGTAAETAAAAAAAAKEGPCAAAFKSGGAAAVIQLLVGSAKFRQTGSAGFAGDKDRPIKYKCKQTSQCRKHYGYLINVGSL